MNKMLVGLICGAALVIITMAITAWVMEKSHKQHLDTFTSSIATGTEQIEGLKEIMFEINRVFIDKKVKAEENHEKLLNVFLSRGREENQAFEERLEVLLKEIRMETIDFNVCIEGLESHSEAIAIALAKRQEERNVINYLFNPNNRYVRIFREYKI